MNENLYQDPIIEWSKKTEHATHLEKADCKSTVTNPLCGDRVSVELMVKHNTIQYMAYQVRGCILCKASSAHLASLAQGLTLDEIKKMREDFDKALNKPHLEQADFPGSHSIFFPVRSHKGRHSCVLLPYDAVIEALEDYVTPAD